MGGEGRMRAQVGLTLAIACREPHPAFGVSRRRGARRAPRQETGSAERDGACAPIPTGSGRPEVRDAREDVPLAVLQISTIRSGRNSLDSRGSPAYPAGLPMHRVPSTS